MTPKLLSHISRMIASGQPIWGMLLANEYLSPQCPLRAALAAKARQHLDSAKKQIHTPIFCQEVLSGRRLQELSIKRIAEFRTSPLPLNAKRYLPSLKDLRVRSNRSALNTKTESFKSRRRRAVPALLTHP
ncbi:MAG: hypothetical protein GX589_07445 [Deltaproteobacteria bacterium]|nr:hypothetical protein [Deltaproteobacteria bacterium]